MTKEKEPKIIITKEAALQITNKEECEKLLNEVKNVKYRAEKIIDRRREEVGRLSCIQDNLQQRLEFLSIVGVVEPNTWYEEKRMPPESRDRCLVLSTNKERNSMQGWQFSPETNNIRRSWDSSDYVFLHPLNDTFITELPMEVGEVIVEEHIVVSLHSYNLRGEKSFLLNWIPSSDLSQAIQKPSILEVRGIIEDMWAQNKTRRLKKEDHDEASKSSLHFIKHNKQWYLLLSLD